VTGGTFNRGNDASTPATISSFRLDTYEITVGRFRNFVAAYSQSMTQPAAGKNPSNASDPGWDSAWSGSLPADASALKVALKCLSTNQTWTDAAGTPGLESLPLNCINWFEAEAFCIWDGGWLPTEAEWNYAAAGGSAQRLYPWGSAAPDCTYANYSPSDFCVAPGNGGAVNRVGSESTKGDGAYGQADLAGNVREWVQDWYAAYTPTCNNCSNLTAASYRMIRGGGFGSGGTAGLVTSYRGYGSPSVRTVDVGARCARTP